MADLNVIGINRATGQQKTSVPSDTLHVNLFGATTQGYVKHSGTDGTYAVLTPSQARSDLAVDQVDNTADADKEVSGPQQAALNLKADAAATASALASKADASAVATALSGKANVSHTHPISQISDATAVGVSLMGATDAAAARTAIGAGTSDLALGSTASTAKPGNYQPAVGDIPGFNSAVNALISAASFSASGTITRATGDSTGTQNITLTFQPKLVIFSFLDSADATFNCDGWDDGTTATCSSLLSSNVLLSLLGTLGLASLSTKSHTVSIWVQTALGAGWQGKISAKSLTGFTVSWTKLGAGRNISGRYFAFG